MASVSKHVSGFHSIAGEDITHVVLQSSVRPTRRFGCLTNVGDPSSVSWPSQLSASALESLTCVQKNLERIYAMELQNIVHESQLPLTSLTMNGQTEAIRSGQGARDNVP